MQQNFVPVQIARREMFSCILRWLDGIVTVRRCESVRMFDVLDVSAFATMTYNDISSELFHIPCVAIYSGLDISLCFTSVHFPSLFIDVSNFGMIYISPVALCVLNIQALHSSRGVVLFLTSTVMGQVPSL